MERGSCQGASHSRGRDGTECLLQLLGWEARRPAKRPRVEPVADGSPETAAGQGDAAASASDVAELLVEEPAAAPSGEGHGQAPVPAPAEAGAGDAPGEEDLPNLAEDTLL